MIAINPIFGTIRDTTVFGSQQLFEVTIEKKLGMVPNAFKGESGSFQVKQHFWEQTEVAYINNPLPSLFKERLFVYLSTFCKTRYCLVRHVGFLTGLGYPAGDRSCQPQSIEQVLSLLKFKLPLHAQLDPFIQFCLLHEEAPVQHIQPDSYMEQAIFACAAHLFLQSEKATESIEALKKMLGATQFEWLIVLLNFIHSTHLSASINTELYFEEDVISMMHSYKQIAACLLNEPEVYPTVFTQQMADDLKLLNTTIHKHKSLTGEYENLLKQFDKFHERQQQQQAALQHMKELQQQAQLLELIHDPVIVWDLNGAIEIWNAGAEKHYGYTKMEATGQVIHQLLQTKAAMQPGEIVETVLAKGEWCGELKHTLKNGKTIVVESRQCLFESAGRQLILETNHDVTARKQVEESLRKSEERLQLAASVTGFGIHDVDMHTRTMYWSPEMKAMHGVPADAEITVEQVADTIHDADREAVMRGVKEMMLPGSKGEFEKELRIRRVDTGEIRWVHNRSRISYAEMDGVLKPVRHTGICVDITERRKEQELLQISEEKYRTLFESMREGFCIIDVLFNEEQVPVDYRFLDINPAFERHTGILNGNGKRMREIVPKHEQFWFDIYGQVAVSGEPVYFQNKSEILNRYYDVHAFKIGASEERKIAVLFKDITQQKALEQQREEFLGIASHELKTPVTSIKIYAEILEEILQESGDIKNAGMMTKLNAQVDRLTDLIKALLDTTKVAEGHLLLNREAFDVNNLIADKTEELQRLTARHRIHWQQPAVSSCIHADKDKIGQVLTNLLSNAIKYSPDGGDIHIDCQHENNQLRISVQDSGLGIPEDIQSRIFDRFYRVRHSHTSTISGLGLGLYITAGIVQHHGGTIQVQSKPGQGSVFSFTLPR